MQPTRRSIFFQSPIAGSFLVATLITLAACSSTTSETPERASVTPSTSVEAEPASAQTRDVASWYPRTVTSERGSAILYAPQIESWEDFETLSAWMAFEISRADSDDSYAGSMRFTAATDTDLASREVLVDEFTVEELHIEGLDDDAKELQLIRDAVTALSRRVPLDLVLEHLPEDMPLTVSEGLGEEVPSIIVATEPALLLSTDGEPRFLPVEGTGLEFLLNTTWDLLRVGEDGPLYLCYQGGWLSADSLDGDWDWADELPVGMLALPATENWSRTRACIPSGAPAVPDPTVPAPIVHSELRPAELLLLDGSPEWASLDDASLDYATNTAQVLLLDGGKYYTTFSGRWFSAVSLEGPWSFATTLPVAFQSIPAKDHALSYLRSSIPGTREAWEAAVEASIPRTAIVERGVEKELAIDVSYAGDPVFLPIDDTGIEYGANTSFQVLRYADTHYLCHNATWLTSSDAEGPWTFADRIPEAFAQIPPESPLYNTTFVKVRGSDADSVEYAYTSGYENAHVTEEGTVVQGSGYDTAIAVSMTMAYGYYGGYYGGWPYYGYPYYWWPPTYGYGSWYDPGSGRYGEAIVAYGPYAAAGGAAVYNPETGVYGRGQAIWDNDEFFGRGFVANPNTGTTIARNRYIDFDDNSGWSQRVARRGDGWRYTESEWEDGRMVTEFESSRGTEGQVIRERDGDTIVSEGQVSRGDRSAEFDRTRERQGDALVSETVIAGEDRSATFNSVIEDGNYQGTVEGSQGGSGTIDRSLDNGEITGGSTFTRDGQTIETDVTRNAEGVKREFETSGGGQGVSRRSGEDSGFAYQSGSGDMYAGRNGSVYKKTDDGWSAVQNPRTDTARSSSLSSTYQSSRGANQYPTTSLNRDYQNRQRGFQRYSQHRQFGGAGRMGGGRMRRR